MKSMRMKIYKAAAAAAGVASLTGMALTANATATPVLSGKDLAPVVRAFLAEHGDLCLGWYTWPRELTPEEQHSGIGESVQLPVLEQLGIVRSEDVPAADSLNTGPNKVYSLTEKGRQYYLQKKHSTIGRHGAITEHDADFCVAHLSLDKVVKWDPPAPQNGHVETIVHYSYHVKAAPFLSDPKAQKVLPVVDRIIRGDGKLLMSVGAQLKDGKWVPVLPGLGQ